MVEEIRDCSKVSLPKGLPIGPVVTVESVRLEMYVRDLRKVLV